MIGQSNCFYDTELNIHGSYVSPVKILTLKKLKFDELRRPNLSCMHELSFKHLDDVVAWN